MSLPRLTDNSSKLIKTASEIAQRCHSATIFPLHLALAFFENFDSFGFQVCKKLDVNGGVVKEKLMKALENKHYSKQDRLTGPSSFGSQVLDLIKRAEVCNFLFVCDDKHVG
jgi:ATP-dependent Clp protease ATP-binding subunit ClpA